MIWGFFDIGYIIQPKIQNSHPPGIEDPQKIPSLSNLCL